MSGSLINDRHRPVRGARAGLEGQRRRWASRMRPTDDGAITRSCTCAPALPLADPRMMLGRSEVCGVQSGRKDGGVHHHKSDHASSGTGDRQKGGQLPQRVPRRGSRSLRALLSSSASLRRVHTRLHESDPEVREARRGLLQELFKIKFRHLPKEQRKSNFNFLNTGRHQKSSQVMRSVTYRYSSYCLVCPGSPRCL